MTELERLRALVAAHERAHDVLIALLRAVATMPPKKAINTLREGLRQMDELEARGLTAGKESFHG